jgi:hypothetical protein
VSWAVSSASASKWGHVLRNIACFAMMLKKLTAASKCPTDNVNAADLYVCLSVCVCLCPCQQAVCCCSPNLEYCVVPALNRRYIIRMNG